MKKKQAHSNRAMKWLWLLPLVIVMGAWDASAQDDADKPQHPSVSDIYQLEDVVVTVTRQTESVMGVPS